MQVGKAQQIRAKRGVSNNKSLTACSIGDEPISRWEKNPYWHHEGPISWFIFEDLTKVVPTYLLIFKFFFTFDVPSYGLNICEIKANLSRNCCLLKSVLLKSFIRWQMTQYKSLKSLFISMPLVQCYILLKKSKEMYNNIWMKWRLTNESELFFGKALKCVVWRSLFSPGGVAWIPPATGRSGSAVSPLLTRCMQSLFMKKVGFRHLVKLLLYISFNFFKNAILKGSLQINNLYGN